MPSTKKILHFISSALLTAISVGILGYGMSAQWAIMKMECGRGGTGEYNGSAEVTLKLFNGIVTRVSCPNFGGIHSFSVIPLLMENSDTVPAVLHGLVLCLLALCMLFSAGSILISLYNGISNPYETYMGPSGVYAFSALSACTAMVALIIFVVNVNVTTMAETMVENFSQGIPTELRSKTTMMHSGFYLLIPYIVLSLGAIASIYIYAHAAYTHKREQQRPTEDAPKEIMMY